MVLIILITGSNQLLTPDAQSDLRLILSGVPSTASGAIPKALEDLLRIIVMSGKKETFCSLNVAVVEEWLKVNIPDAGLALDRFMVSYKHRGMCEMDVYSPTWDLNHGIVISMLQRGLVQISSVDQLNNYKTKLQYSPGKLVAQMKTKKGCLDRLFLRVVLKRSQKSLVVRELVKNNLLKCLHEFRLGIRHLGNLLIREGRIPQSDLVFFMTPVEWQTIVKNWSPELARRAVQRKRIFFGLKGDRYPAFTLGPPEPFSQPPVVYNQYGNKVSEFAISLKFN